MLTLICSDKLKKERVNIKDQVICDILYDGFNNTILSIEDLAAALGMQPDTDITLV